MTHTSYITVIRLIMITCTADLMQIHWTFWKPIAGAATEREEPEPSHDPAVRPTNGKPRLSPLHFWISKAFSCMQSIPQNRRSSRTN